ncbi:MAG: glucuronyl hydrolase [Micrococcales bacterium 73-15]|nr:MAG: glucuronyl hydrolase [Micrococcales bacterium 73-15]
MTPTVGGSTAAPATTSLAAATDAALAVVDENVGTFGDRYPGDTTIGGRYELRPAARISGRDLPPGSNYEWTTSFWPGELWLAWELTGRDVYRDLGLAHVANFVWRVEEEVDLHTHDLGFLYTLACVTPDRLVGSPEGRRAALAAADHLMKRFLEPAGIIQAWGDLETSPEQRGRTIIDSLMNMPLLHWASEQTGDPRYEDAARRHVAQLRDRIVRDDDTTFHTFHWDVATGEPRFGSTQQGYADDSCWARGQAWGIYGFALNHRWTGEATFLDTAVRCAEYFLAHLPRDRVAYWDLVFSDGDDQPRDSSAASIAACGLLELAAELERSPRGGELSAADAERVERYRREAREMVDSLATSYAGGAANGSNALLLHGVYDWRTDKGVDEGNLWGDYFYLEALMRLQRPDWVPYW